MATNKSLRGTGNLLQDLLSSVVRLKKCDKQIVSANSVKSELKIKLQFIHCFICGVNHQRRPLSEVKVEILREIILKSFHDLISTTSICPLCSTTLDKLIDLRKKADEISGCIRSLIKLRHDLSGLKDTEIQEASSEIIDNDNDSSGVKSCGIEMQNSTTEIIYNVTLNDKDKHSSVLLSNGKSNDEDVGSEDEVTVPDLDNHESIISKPAPSPSPLENLTCPECKVTFDKLWKLNRHQRNPWLNRSRGQNMSTDKETNAQNFEGSNSPNVDNTNANNEDPKKCKSDISDYDCVPIDDLIFPIVEESIKASEDDKVDYFEVNLDGACAPGNNSDGNFIVELSPEFPLALAEIDNLVLKLDGGSEPVNNYDGNFVVGTPELPLEEIDEGDDGVDIEEFVQCKTESEEIHDPAQGDVVLVPCVTEYSGGLQIAKVKNEDGEEVKLFTNLDGVYDIVPNKTIIESMPPTLENLTCPECKVTFDKSWKLNRHLRNPWLDRSRQINKRRSRSTSYDDEETDLQNDAKRPRLSRIRAEKLIKSITNRDKLNKNDYDTQGDSDFHASSDSSTSDEIGSSSGDESLYGEDNNNLSRPELNIDDTEICTETGRYKCLKCNTTYSSNDHLRRHLTTTFVHTGRNRRLRRARPVIPYPDEITSFKCTICGRQFDNEATLTTHIVRHDNQCDICDLKFSNEIGLREHLYSEKHAVALRCRSLNDDGLVTFSCDKCDQVEFPDLLGIFDHVKKLHKSFPLSIALVPTQNEIETLKCTICAVTFDDVETLTQHKSTHDKKCDICDHKFLHKKHLHTHLKSKKHCVALKCRRLNEDGVATFSCDQCDQVGFPDLSGLLQHRQTIHAEILLNVCTEEEITTLQCKICNKKFDDRSTLVTHKPLHRRTCEVCELTFNTPRDIRGHRRSRNHQLAVLARRVDSDGKVSFICDERCPDVQTFPNYQKLVDHRKSYHPGRNIFNDGTTGVKSCLPCDKVFYTVRSYNYHLLTKGHAATIGATESLSLDFACNICDRKYVTNAQLTAHIRNSHNQAFVCEMCGMRCRDLARLTTHQKTHVEPSTTLKRLIPPEEKRYSCNLCDKRFSRANSRNKHVNNVHKGKGKRYKCDVCQKILASPEALKYHKKHVHNLENGEPQSTTLTTNRLKSQRITCDVCLRRSSRYQSIDVPHIEIVHFQDKSKCPYACSDLEFETEQEWTQHLEGCTSEKITEAFRCSCFYCGALFRNQLLRLSHHIQSHQTFSCEICSKVFTRQQSLDLHTNSHQEAKPHLCPKCGKRFRQAWNLKLHLTLICGDDEEARQKLLEKRKAQYKSFRAKKMNFKCDECSEGFVSERRLELHRKKVHDKDASGAEDESDTDS